MTAQINYDELAWLDAYRKAIREQHPDTVVKMMIFSHEGVIAEQHEFTDLNILLVVKDSIEVEHLEQLRLLGYSLSDPPDYFIRLFGPGRRASGKTLIRNTHRNHSG